MDIIEISNECFLTVATRRSRSDRLKPEVSKLLSSSRANIILLALLDCYTTGNKTFDKMVVNELEEFINKLVSKHKLRYKD